MSEENVAVLIDYENVGNQAHMRALLDELSGVGRIVVKRAFGDWKKEGTQNQQQLQALGIELIHHSQTTRGKNASDIRLTAEAVGLLHTSLVEITTFVIASCDSDFFPLITILRSQGKSVIVAGRKEVTTEVLINSCDRFIDLTDLVRSSDISESDSDSPPPANSEPSSSVETNTSQDTQPETASSEALRIDANTRELVVRAIQSASDQEGIVKGAMLHGTIRRIDPSFNFKKHGFNSFSNFLEGIPEIVVERSHGPQDITVKIGRDI